jgi:two-component system, NarL family, response regulator LiaR
MTGQCPAAHERDILRLVAQGYENQEIAAELHLSAGTIRNYIAMLFEQYELRNRAQLAVYAVRCGAIALEPIA